LSDGRFVVVWSDLSRTGGDTSSNAIRAQIVGADGAPIGAAFLVNTTTAFLQNNPTISTLADGRFVVAWADLSGSGNDTSSLAIRGQVFSSTGAKSGSEFLVNTTTADFQNQPTITGLTNGRFVVAWTDGSETGGFLPLVGQSQGRKFWSTQLRQIANNRRRLLPCWMVALLRCGQTQAEARTPLSISKSADNCLRHPGRKPEPSFWSAIPWSDCSIAPVSFHGRMEALS
jgi:hypothetical protein